MFLFRATIFYLTIQIFHFKLHSLAADTNDAILNIFEAFGYSPSCVAKCLTACEHSTKSPFEKEVIKSLSTIITLLNETNSERNLLQNCTEAKDMEPANKQQPKCCAEIKAMGDNKSGVRTIYPAGGLSATPVEVFCDQTTDGGGWIVFQNRDNLAVREDFYRSWDDYVAGFGNLTGEFWLGLDKIQALVSSTKMEMRVDLEDYEGEKRWAKYSTFSIGDNSTKYQINIGGYTGDAEDGFRTGKHNGRKFSTKDQDNDDYIDNCAKLYKGGWWYDQCHISNLNGFQHVGKHASFADGINWAPWKGYYYSLQKTSMKIRSL